VTNDALPAVTRLGLRDFRSYQAFDLRVPPSPVVITGPNGAGKTNLLEALSLLAPGRGLRRASAAEMTRLGAPGGWAISARIATEVGAVEVASQAAGSGERRQTLIDGEPQRGQNRLDAILSVLWLTPAMDRLFTEAPAGRRRFLDRLCLAFDPSHGTRVNAYDQALRDRSKLLRDGPSDPAWLSALEDGMARHGAAVAATRRQVTQALSAAMADAKPSPFPTALLEVSGSLEAALADQPALAVEDRFRAELAASRKPEADGAPTPGPHRSDLAARHGATGMPAALCSTGEQKALLIAIQLAAARLIAADSGRAPLLLLDEVAAHLDSLRRDALFDSVLALGGQAWFTGTDAETFAALRDQARFVEIDTGGIESSLPGPVIE
jgi:DNA replication and repair protein RecF